jgi:predicted O-methyltransferase YrrM
MTKEEIYQMKGQVCNEEVDRLIWLASQVPENGLIVEIGAYCGKSSSALAFGMPKSANLMSIDPWVLTKCKTTQEYEKIETVKTYADNLSFAYPKVVQVIAYPHEIRKFVNKPIDLLFIDSIKIGITPIWEDWLPLVKQGGWIASHDYLPKEGDPQFYPEVVKVIEEKIKPITIDHHHITYTFSGKKK